MVIPHSKEGRTRLDRGLGRLILAHAVAVFLIFINAGIAEATMIVTEVQEPHLDSWDIFLFRLTSPHHSGVAEACGLPSLLSPAKDPLADTRTASRMDSVVASGAPAFGQTDPEAPAPEVAMASIEQVRARVRHIVGCQRYLQYILEIMRRLSAGVGAEWLNPLFDGSIRVSPIPSIFGPMRRSGADSSQSSVAYLGYIAKYGFRNDRTLTANERRFALTRGSENLASTSSSKKNLAHNPTVAKAGPAATRKTRNGKSKPKNERPEHQGATSVISIKTFVIDLFSNVYTYMVVFVFIVLNLFLRHRI